MIPDCVVPPPSGICGHWIGVEGRHCLSTDNVLLYVIGRRCPVHTPAAMAALRKEGTNQ